MTLQVSEEQLKELIAQGVREELAKLSLSVSTSSEFDGYSDRKYVTVSVALMGVDDTICYSSDSFSVQG